MPNPLILARAIHIAATLLAAGTVFFAVLAAEPAFAGVSRRTEGNRFRRRCIRMIWWALVVTIVSGAAWLVLLSAAILNVSVLDVCLHGGWLKVAGATLFGQAWTARLILSALLAGLLMWPAARWLQAAVAAAFAALIAFSGHASATPGFVGDIHLAADMAHLIAAAAWLGALPALALLLSVALRRKDPEWDAIAIAATARFSWVGIACVATLLASGIVASIILLSSPRDLIATSYGRLLSVKIALFLTMVGVAAVNRIRLTPRLPRSIGTLVRTSLVEIVLGLGVVAAVASLGTMEPGEHVHIAPVEIPADAAFVHLHMPEVMADVTIDPGHPGRAHAIIHVMREDATDFPTHDVKFALDPPKASTQSPPHVATHLPDGKWRVNNLDLSEPGVWTIYGSSSRPERPPRPSWMGPS